MHFKYYRRFLMKQKQLLSSIVMIIWIIVILVGCDVTGNLPKESIAESVIDFSNNASPPVGLASSRAVTDWHCMTQAAREGAIIYRAYQDDGKKVGLNCKEWARKVVYDASGGAVWLPSTNSSNYYWEPHPYVYGFSSLLQYAHSGDIVQMRWKAALNYGPHTAIIIQVSSTGVCFMELNYLNDLTVRIRSLTHAEFYNQVDLYTINRIL